MHAHTLHALNIVRRCARRLNVNNWTWQGVVEIVPRACPLQLSIEPLGALDKATAPWRRLILDARISNEYQDPWGVWYFSVSQLAALLDFCDIMFANLPCLLEASFSSRDPRGPGGPPVDTGPDGPALC